MKHHNYSGGAIGSDMLFELEGVKYGVKTTAYSFYGHNTISKNKWNLTSQQLEEGYQHIKISNNSLNRNITNISSYVKKLLCRNWFQVKNSDCIFAIGNISDDFKFVKSGTGWAVQMSIDNNKPVFLFEQNENSWFEYSYEEQKFVKINYIPKLTKNFAGIGTREINENGKKAIIELFKENFDDKR